MIREPVAELGLLGHSVVNKLTAILIVLLVLAAVPTWYAFDRGYFSTTRYTCAYCRAIQYSERVMWSPRVRIEKTDFTLWYEQTQPPHVHFWAWCGSRRTDSLSGVSKGSGQRHPVWSLDLDMQSNFVRSASSAELQHSTPD